MRALFNGIGADVQALEAWEFLEKRYGLWPYALLSAYFRQGWDPFRKYGLLRSPMGTPIRLAC